MDKNRKAALRAAIGCAMLYSATSGVAINCRGIFYIGMADTLGVSLSMVTLYVLVGGVIGSFFLPTLCRLFRDYPVRRVLPIYSAALVLSTALMSRAQNIYVFYAFATVQCTVNGFLLFYPIPYVLGNFYPDKKGTVLGLVLMSSGIVGVVLNPPLERLISEIGWQNAFLCTALLMAVLQFPAEFFLIRKCPEDAFAEPVRSTDTKSGSRKHAEPMPFCEKPVQLYPMIGVFILVNLFIALAQQFPSIAAANGFSSAFGATLVSVCMFGNMAGKLVYGNLNDRVGTCKTAVLFMGLGMLGFVFSSVGQKTSLLAGALLFAGLLSVQMLTSPLLFRAYSKEALYDRVYPAVCSITMILSSVSQFFLSFCYEQSGSYRPVLYAGAAATAVCIVIVIGYERKARKLK